MTTERPSPFLSMPGAWVWITYSGWYLNVWYAPTGSRVGRLLARMYGVSAEHGAPCFEESASPGGRYVLLNMPWFGGVLFDRRASG
ncbi:MAG: hypothetical protein LC772_11190, partial [Chloroflexi bacterium]|nr:hypothetical protein [Chloroflexota bacterium]